jgi:hypothetical protein
MYLGKEEKPFGLKVIHFLVTNTFWYLIFSFIYLNFDIREWWLIQNSFGRFILLFLELTMFYSAFKKD